MLAVGIRKARTRFTYGGSGTYELLGWKSGFETGRVLKQVIFSFYIEFEKVME